MTRLKARNNKKKLRLSWQKIKKINKTLSKDVRPYEKIIKKPLQKKHK